MKQLTIRTRPSLVGNYQRLEDQEAQNTLELRRLIGGWRVPTERPLIWQGPVYLDPAERERLFTHGGITHTNKAVLANAMNLPSSKRAMFPGGDDMFAASLNAAATLENGDPRKVDLLRFGNGDGDGKHYVTNNRAAWQLLGFTLYNTCIAANNDTPISFIGADMENQHEAESGSSMTYQSAVYEGFQQAINAAGHACKLFTYGTANLAGVVNYTTNRQDNDFYYRVPGEFWRGNGGRLDVNSPNTAVFRQNGGFVGRDQYARRTCGKDLSLWQKNPNGTIKVDGDGNPMFAVGNEQITLFGQTCMMYKHERRYWLEMFYEQLDLVVTELRFWCNTSLDYAGDFQNMPYPKGTHDIRPGLEKLKQGYWYRNNTEVEDQWDPDAGSMEPLYTTPEKGVEAGNQRPLNPDAIEYQFLLRTIVHHLNTIFSNEGNYLDWAQGQQGNRRLDYRPIGGMDNQKEECAFGQFEVMLKARLRGTNYPDLFALWDAGMIEFIIPKRPIKAGNRAYGEREIDKPAMIGFKERSGRRIWWFWCYPCQDYDTGHNRAIKWFVDTGAVKSPLYILACIQRKTGFTMMLLPEGCESARPQDFKFEFDNLLNQTFQFTGDFNVPVTQALELPAQAEGPELVTLTFAEPGDGPGGGGDNSGGVA